MPHRWPVAAALAGAGLSFALLPFPAAAFAAALAGLAVYVAAVDLDRFIIPDAANVAIFAAGLAFVGVDSWNTSLLGDLADALLRALAAGGFMWSLRFIYARRTGIEGLGLGDVKLAAAAAPWLAWNTLPLTLALAAIACALALAARALLRGEPIERGRELPFGAFLAPALWAVFVLVRLGWFAL
ncbi:MAG TPA: prepilin peptidase [Pseudolabrys sp.]|nr:prepilin peptidase [Pseudolabrys sp.]